MASTDSLSGTTLGDLYNVMNEFVRWLMRSFPSCDKTQAWGRLFVDTDAAKQGKDREEWMSYLAMEVYDALKDRKKALQERNAEDIFTISLPIVKEVGLKVKYEAAMDEAARNDVWVYMKALFNLSKKFKISGNQPSRKRGGDPQIVQAALLMSKSAGSILPDGMRSHPEVIQALNEFVRECADVEPKEGGGERTEVEAARSILPLASILAERLASIARAIAREKARESEDASWLHGVGGLVGGEGGEDGEKDALFAAMKQGAGLAADVEEMDEDKMGPEDYLSFLESNAGTDMSGLKEVVRNMPPEIVGRIADMQRGMIKELKGMAKSGKSMAALGAAVMRNMEEAPVKFKESFSEEQFREASRMMSKDPEAVKRMMKSYESLKSKNVLLGVNPDDIIRKMAKR